MKEKGSNGFSQNYWDENYAEPKTMDGIGNAKEHIRYLRAYFAVDIVDISTIADLGAGLGHMFRQSLSIFRPYKALAIEPSDFAYKKLTSAKSSRITSTELDIKQIDLLSWCQDPNEEFIYDLGICTSVFQYLKSDEIKMILPILSHRFKYLYFSVPTDMELGRQRREIEFYDKYALRRSRSAYQKLLAPYFTVISSRVLESKKHFNQETSFFTDLLFRN